MMVYEPEGRTLRGIYAPMLGLPELDFKAVVLKAWSVLLDWWDEVHRSKKRLFGSLARPARRCQVATRSRIEIRCSMIRAIGPALSLPKPGNTC